MTSTIVASFVAVYAALFPVINPLGGGPIFLNMVQGCSQGVRNKLALGVSVNSFFMLFGSMLIGPELLLFFGITLPALKLAGGLVVIAMGWNLLNQKSSPKDGGDGSSVITDASAQGSAFFPLTMPLTVGPGSIATAISLMAGLKKSSSLGFDSQIPALIGGLIGLIALALTIYLVYRESSGIQRLLGVNGTNVLMRLFAFILLAIGVQIFLGGLEGFAGDLQKILAPHQ
jgi:multiple antibiotic resistance protein